MISHPLPSARSGPLPLPAAADAFPAQAGALVIGVLPGEGVGPALTELCQEVLEIVGAAHGRHFAFRRGGPMGMDSLRTVGSVLPEALCDFCHEVFSQGGAVLAGPGGGRFVYELRRRFALYVKLNPLRSYAELADAGRLKIPPQAPVDILVVRENLGGLYQGQSQAGDQRVEHRFENTASEVRRLVLTAAQFARQRRRHLTVVAKESGLPELSRLWFECGREAAEECGVAVRTMDMDFAAYQMLSRPEEFDVVAVPNCFGDILADLGGLFCASRGATYGASFSEDGWGVYQTNHGAAYDLAQRNTANPAGQLFATAMMLRESFGLADEARAVEGAVRQAWQEGYRTADVMAPGCRLSSTTEFGERVGQIVRATAPAALPA